MRELKFELWARLEWNVVFSNDFWESSSHICVFEEMPICFDSVLIVVEWFDSESRNICESLRVSFLFWLGYVWIIQTPHGRDAVWCFWSLCNSSCLLCLCLHLYLFLVACIQNVCLVSPTCQLFERIHILGIIIPIEQYFSEGLKPLTSFVGRFVPIKMKITGWFKHMTTVLEG